MYVQWNVRLEWDEAKRLTNLAKHGLDFVDAEKVFEGETVEVEDTREDYGEDRFLTFGLLGDEVVVIANVLRGDAIRIISMRKGLKHEQEFYFESIWH
ncbi:BrnT family toxin [uncultured Meiothermus sp.]|jgi:uncharacterized DUF497 family protein|uniref:BrnT family toxin n=1 Tax=uncultured Meiothermus sp. TaxID=157471 RepID=UPI0026252DE8|nr:BrnT family toxin [uncultured Meiothermus sp.]